MSWLGQSPVISKEEARKARPKACRMCIYFYRVFQIGGQCRRCSAGKFVEIGAERTEDLRGKNIAWYQTGPAVDDEQDELLCIYHGWGFPVSREYEPVAGEVSCYECWKNTREGKVWPPHRMIRALIEVNQFTMPEVDAQIGIYFDSRKQFRDFMKGKYELTVEQITALAKRFCIDRSALEPVWIESEESV